MAQFLNNINLNGNEIQNFLIQPLATAPSSGLKAGRKYFNTAEKREVIYDGTKWLFSAYKSDLESYALASTVDGIDTRLKSVETIFETDNDGTINKWNEVVDFLAGIEGDKLDTILDTFALKETTISAGEGLTGTLKLDGTGTFSLATAGTAGTYCKVTTDKYGRVTSGVTALAISDVTNLSTRLSSIDTTVAGHTTSIATLNGYFTNGKANNADKLDEHDSSYFATASALNTLTSRVTTAEGNITTLMDWYNEVGQHFKYDSTNEAWYLEGDFYTTGQNAAGEAGSTSDGGSGSGIILNYDAIVGALGYVPATTTALDDATSRVAVLESYFTGGVANNANKLGGNDSSYFATASDLTSLTTRVETLEDEATSVSYAASTASTAVIGTLTIDGTATDISLRAVNVTAALGYTPTKKLTFNITANGNTTQSFTHNLGTRDVIVQIFEPSSPYEQVYADVCATSTSQVSVTFAETPTKAYKVVIIG